MATTYICDCCLTEATGLATLQDNYATPNIKEICENCLAEFEKALSPVKVAHQKELEQTAQNFLYQRRADLT